MNTPEIEYPLDAPDWTDKGCAALVDGDIIRVVDHPIVKDESKRGAWGTYAPVLGPDGKPVFGERRTVGRVLGLSPTLQHPNAAAAAGMASGFFRAVYVEVLHSEGCGALEVGQTISFLQHNANVIKRKTHRWPLTGPNWPATSTARERHAVVEAFEATAAEQRARINAWLPLRTTLEVIAKEAGRKPKDLLQELVPEEVMADPEATRLWVAHLWNGQAELDESLAVQLTDLLLRLGSDRSDDRRAA